MVNLFETKKRNFENGILVDSHFNKGYCGTISIHTFETLNVSLDSKPKKYSRAKLDLHGLLLEGGFENPTYGFKNKQPYDRGDPTTYLGYSFDDLNAIPTSDGGRFFLLKTPWPSPITSVDCDSDRKMTVVHGQDDLETLSQDLGTILELCGVPQRDVRQIQKKIFRKLNYEANRIADSYPHVNSGELFRAYVATSGNTLSNMCELIQHLHDKGLSPEEIQNFLARKKDKKE